MSWQSKDGGWVEVTVHELDGNRRYDLEELESWLAEQRTVFEGIGGEVIPINGDRKGKPPDHWHRVLEGDLRYAL